MHGIRSLRTVPRWLTDMKHFYYMFRRKKNVHQIIEWCVRNFWLAEKYEDNYFLLNYENSLKMF